MSDVLGPVCTCRSVAIRPRNKGTLVLLDGCPVLSGRLVPCRSRKGVDITCHLGVGSGPILLVGGRLRAANLDGRSHRRFGGLIMNGLRMSATRRASGLLIIGLTRTAGGHTPRTRTITECVERHQKVDAVLYNSFGSKPVSCIRHAVTGGLMSYCMRDNGKPKVDCRHNKFFMQVSGVVYSRS